MKSLVGVSFQVLYVHAYAYVSHVHLTHLSNDRDQKKVSDPLELKLTYGCELACEC